VTSPDPEVATCHPPNVVGLPLATTPLLFSINFFNFFFKVLFIYIFLL